MTQNPYQGPPAGYPQQPPAGPPPYQPAPGQGGYPGQNPYQQVPPQEMSPAAQQYPPPGGYAPPAQPQYAPAPPQGPPPGQWPDGTQRQLPYGQAPAAPPAYSAPPAAAAPSGGDGWGDPGSGNRQDGDSPAVHQLDNRLVFIRPIKMHSDGKKFGTQEPEEQMFVDIVVCDGPPIAAHIHGNTKVETPFATGPKVPPFFIGNALINKAVMDKVMDYLPGRGTCLGRIVRRPAKGQGFPWADLAPATEQDKALARQIFPRWDELKAAATPPRPDQYGPPQGQPAPAPYQPQPGPYAQPAPQGPPPGYGAPPQGYPQQPAYPPPY